jgi:large subunit ribosomal protein L29
MVLKAKEIREFTPKERRKKLKELKSELMHERGIAAMGGSPASPGKIRQIRGEIAKLLTIMREGREK